MCNPLAQTHSLIIQMIHGYPIICVVKASLVHKNTGLRETVKKLTVPRFCSLETVENMPTSILKEKCTLLVKV